MNWSLGDVLLVPAPVVAVMCTTVHAVDRLSSECPGASVARCGDPGGEDRRLGATATRVLEGSRRAEPSERADEARRASANETVAVERAEARPMRAGAEGREPAVQRRRQTEHRGNEGAVIARSFFVDLVDLQGCLAHGRMRDAATELHERTPPTIDSLVKCVLELGAGTDGDRECAPTRAEPPLDVRERCLPLEAEHAVEEEQPRVCTDRERRSIAEVEHSKVERLLHVGRCSREEVENGRQLDPLEVVHAPSLLLVAVRAEPGFRPNCAACGDELDAFEAV